MKIFKYFWISLWIRIEKSFKRNIKEALPHPSHIFFKFCFIQNSLKHFTIQRNINSYIKYTYIHIYTYIKYSYIKYTGNPCYYLTFYRRFHFNLFLRNISHYFCHIVGLSFGIFFISTYPTQTKMKPNRLNIEIIFAASLN